MSTTLNLNSTQAVAGLGTSTYTVITAGAYFVDCQSTLPPSSGLQIVINLNGSPVLTTGGATTNPTPTQMSIGGAARILCAATDVITVVLSSSNAVDANPNAVKSTINLFLTV